MESNTDGELVQILKQFIAAKRESNVVESQQQYEENTGDTIVLLQQQHIKQITNPNVTKIRGAPSKKRMKSAIEVKRNNKVLMQEIGGSSGHETETSSRNQRKCLLCGVPGHYQKKCPNIKE